MTTHVVRIALAFGLAGVMALISTDAADAARFQAEWTPVSRPESAPTLEVGARSDAKPVTTPDHVRGMLFAERAPRKRAIYKKPRSQALVARPSAAPPSIREADCVSQPNDMGAPAYTHCEAAFRRLYSR